MCFYKMGNRKMGRQPSPTLCRCLPFTSAGTWAVPAGRETACLHLAHRKDEALFISLPFFHSVFLFVSPWIVLDIPDSVSDPCMSLLCIFCHQPGLS